MSDDPYPSLITPIPMALDVPSAWPDVEGYEITGIIGEGSMSVVYEARLLRDGSEVALKVLREPYAFDDECVSRLEREVRIAACVHSPHVPKTYGLVRTSTGIPCIAMERLRGKSLAEILHWRGTFSVAETLDCTFQICAALRAAHPLGVVHRDLKPSNIFFAEEGESLTVKVMDFGLSKLEGDLELTGQHALFGTPKYMSPEQVRSAKLVDPRSDLWSLGVILYRMLSGKFPFDGAGYAAILSAILMREPPHLTTVMPHIDRLLGAVVMNLLKKDPSLRYQDVDELESALRTFTRSDSERQLVDDVFEVEAALASERTSGLLAPTNEHSLGLPIATGASMVPVAFDRETRGHLDEEALRRMKPSRLPAVMALAAFGALVAMFSFGVVQAGAAAAAGTPAPTRERAMQSSTVPHEAHVLRTR